jgi:hypothetical protein
MLRIQYCICQSHKIFENNEKLYWLFKWQLFLKEIFLISYKNKTNKDIFMLYSANNVYKFIKSLEI